MVPVVAKKTLHDAFAIFISGFLRVLALQFLNKVQWLTKEVAGGKSVLSQQVTGQLSSWRVIGLPAWQYFTKGTAAGAGHTRVKVVPADTVARCAHSSKEYSNFEAYGERREVE